MSVNLKPAGPCPKCGGKVWEGPRHTMLPNLYDGGPNDWLGYICAECRYAQYVTPLDRQALSIDEIIARSREKP